MQKQILLIIFVKNTKLQNCSWPQATGKSHNKKSLTYKSGERGISGSQSGQLSSKDKESHKLTGFFKKMSVNQYKKNNEQQNFYLKKYKIGYNCLCSKNNIFD